MMWRAKDVTMTYRKDRAERAAIAGIITGAVLFVITCGLLIYGLILIT